MTGVQTCALPISTTKADCLNWIFQGVEQEEARKGSAYDVVLQHDAEDLIHPRSLRLIARHCERHGMVQIPVFPLQSPIWQATHGTYCDFFAEAHLKDLWVRTKLGGFLPSAGVGTAYRRDAFEKLRKEGRGQPFDPRSLTEDYVTGLQLHRLGCSQVILAPLAVSHGGGTSSETLLATREYFPRRFRAAVRQRARWVTGIGLQSWQRFGWRTGRQQAYWLWRDRKALINHPLSLLTNLVFGYGLLRWGWSWQHDVSWMVGNEIISNRWLLGLLAANLALLAGRQCAAAACTGKVYGWGQALTLPLRAPWTNLINCCAVFQAWRMFLPALARGRGIGWRKTTHAYPDRRQRAAGQARLGEILVMQGRVSREAIRTALRSQPLSERLGDYLVRRRLLSEDDLYRALSLQHGLEFERVEPREVDANALQSMPRDLAASQCLIPFRRRQSGDLAFASPELPNESLLRTLGRYHRFDPRLVLITPTDYHSLASRLTASVPSHVVGIRPFADRLYRAR